MSELIVGSVGVQLVPSAEGFREKTKSLLSGLVVDIGLKLDDTLARAQLDELTHARTATVNVNADTGEAEAQIDAVARNRRSTINVNTDGLAKASSEAGGLGGAMGAIAGAVAFLAPALVPVAAGLSGIAVTAGVAAKAVLDVEKTNQKIAQLRATAATTTSKATQAQALAQAAFLENSLNGTQKKFLAAQHSVGGAFTGLLNKVGPSLFRPLTAGLNLVADILPKLAPLIRVTANYFGDLITKLDKNVRGGGFTSFLNYVKATIPTVLGFLGSLTQFLGRLFVGLAPAGQVVLQVLTSIFGLLAKVPADVLAPVAVGLVGLFAGPEIAAAAAFAVILETLYQKSSFFRGQIDSIAASVKKSLAPAFAAIGQFFTNSLLPIIRQVGPALLVIVGGFIKVAAAVLGFVIPAYLKMESVLLKGVVPVFRFLLNVWLDVVGGIIHAAAAAFGWVPGVGKKLKAAAAGFDAFAADARAALNSIHGKTVVVTIDAKVNPVLSLVAGGGLLPIKGAKNAIPLGTPKPKSPPKPAVSFGGAGNFSAPKSSGRGGGSGRSLVAARKEARKLIVDLNAAANVGGAKLVSALDAITSHISDFPKKVRKALAGMAAAASAQLTALGTTLDGLKSQFADVASSITQAFTPSDLFSGTLLQLTGGLAKGLANIKAALAAQKTLLAAGVSAAFVGSLLSSGNSALAVQLAADPSQAIALGSQFAQLQAQAGTLGQDQATAQFGAKIDGVTAELKKVGHDVVVAIDHQAHVLNAGRNNSNHRRAGRITTSRRHT